MVGRLATLGVVAAGMAWIPFLPSHSGGSFCGYLQVVQSLLAPSIAAVFMLGIFSRLAFGSTTPAQQKDDRQSFGFWDIFHTAMILAIIVGAYIVFW